MNIRFASTLTHEDENRVAPALLAAVGALLDRLPIAYSLRIDTIDGTTFRRTGPDRATTELGELPKLSERRWADS